MNPFSRKAKLANEMAHQQSYSAEPYREGMDYTDEAWAYGLRALPGSLANQLQDLGEYTTGKDYPNYAGNYLDELTQVNEMGYTPQTEYEAGVAFLPELVYDPAIVAGAPYTAYKAARNAPKLMNVLADEAGRTGMRNQLGVIPVGTLESVRARGVTGDDLLNVSDLADDLDSVGALINADGTVTAYHRTNPESAEAILQSGRMKAKEPDIFFSTSKESEYGSGFGDDYIEAKLPLEKIRLDDIFPGKDASISIHAGRIGREVPVDITGSSLGNLGAFKSQLGAVDLPMDEASRMARAREMGFDTDQALYHGSPVGKNIKAFDLDAPMQTDYGFLGNGVYTSPKKWLANAYTRGDYDGDVLELLTSSKKIKDFNYYPDQNAYHNQIKEWADELGVKSKWGTKEWARELREKASLKGWDGARGLNQDGSTVETVIYNTNQLRKKDAKFDPAKKDSADLLASKLLPIPAGLLGLTTLDQDN